MYLFVVHAGLVQKLSKHPFAIQQYLNLQNYQEDNYQQLQQRIPGEFHCCRFTSSKLGNIEKILVCNDRWAPAWHATDTQYLILRFKNLKIGAN